MLKTFSAWKGIIKYFSPMGTYTVLSVSEAFAAYMALVNASAF
jgi:hypothetical protein